MNRACLGSMPQSLTGVSRGQLAIVNHYFTVDQHKIETLRILMGFGEGRFVFDAGGVEEDEVGGHAFADQTSIAEREGSSGQGSHAADRVFPGEDAAVAHV